MRLKVCFQETFQYWEMKSNDSYYFLVIYAKVVMSDDVSQTPNFNQSISLCFTVNASDSLETISPMLMRCIRHASKVLES